MTQSDSTSAQTWQPVADAMAKRLAATDGARRWRLNQRSQAVLKALAKNGFEAVYVETHDAARDAVLERIPDGARVGIGGSVTIRQLGIPDVLLEKGHTLYDHWQPGLTPEQILEIRHAQLSCDVFLSSVNAITLDGQIVSVDGLGNRVAATIFGPGRVILVIGAQKITSDLDAAMARLRDICAPVTLRSLGADTPCAKDGVCARCGTDKRLCRATVILDCPSALTPTTVIIVGEEIGL